MPGKLATNFPSSTTVVQYQSTTVVQYPALRCKSTVSDSRRSHTDRGQAHGRRRRPALARRPLGLPLTRSSKQVSPPLPSNSVGSFDCYAVAGAGLGATGACRRHRLDSLREPGLPRQVSAPTTPSRRSTAAHHPFPAHIKNCRPNLQVRLGCDARA